MSNQWATLQSHYLKSQQIKTKGLSGEVWTKVICTTIITLWLELWDERNKDQHGRDETQKAKRESEQAIREITILYTYQDKVLQRDRHIFDKSIDSHIKCDTRYLRQWINTNQPVILKSAKSAKTKSILHVHILSTYFQIGKRPH